MRPPSQPRTFSRLSALMHPPFRRLPSRGLASALNRPSPPPLPREQQREFEELQRAAQTPPAQADLALHPDARKPPKPDFEGDTNPLTGEQGGPKTEPVGKWVEQDDGDWSFKGRVSDF